MNDEKIGFEGNVLLRVGSLFLIANMLERLAYYGLTGQLVYIYTSIFGNSSSTASKYQAIFQTLAYISPLFGAILADQFLGRYKTILVSYPPYFVGVVLAVLSQLLSVTPWKEPTKTQTTIMSAFFTVGTSACIAVGAGFLKPNLIVLGADQFNSEIEEQRKQQSFYFSAFYWSTNVAAFVAFFAMSTLAVNGVGAIKAVKHKSMRVFLVALISAAFICFSMAIAVAMRSRVYSPKPSGSVLLSFIGAVYQSWNTNVFSIMTVLGTFGYCMGILIGILGLFIKDKDKGVLTYISAGFILVSSVFHAIASPRCGWIELSSTENGGSFDPKAIIGFRAVLSIFRFVPYSIIFWAVYNAMNTFFFMQGCVMKTQVFSFYNMPSSQLPAWNCLVIIIFVPIHQEIIYPLVSRLGFKMTLLRKSGYGLLWTAIGMFVASGIEVIRKSRDLTSSPSACFDKTKEIVLERDMNVLLLIFAYGSVAMAEIGYAISCYEFYYSQVPPGVRSVVQSINMFTTSLGTMASGIVLTIFEAWIPDNLDAGHIEYLYMVLGSLAVLNLAIFTIVSIRYTYVDFSGADRLSLGADENEFAVQSTDKLQW